MKAAHLRLAALACGCMLFAAPAIAKDVPSSAQVAEHRFQATRVTQALTIDGRLDEPAWESAPEIALTQQDPHPGEATIYSTRARVLIDGHRLYLGIEAEDPSPAKLAVHTLEFDADQSNDDHVTLVLDTFGDHRLGYVFDLNAGGARADGLLSPSSRVPSYDWNGDWVAKVRATERGWTAEIAIDIRSLQFRRGLDAWGINLRRYVPREQMNEQWAGISLDASVFDLARAGELTGVGGFESGHGLEVSPYAAVRTDAADGSASGDVGVDVRYNVAPDLAAILTINPDFAETEADAVQVNLTRFSLFLPEKRRFFLDGANHFTFAAGLDDVFIPFYSRRVGVANDLPVRLDAGLKLVGQSGPWSIGVLGVETGRSTETAPTRLAVARSTYDIDEHLRVGALLTQGDPSGHTENRFSGFDGVWHTSTFHGDKNLTVAGWVARSEGDDRPGQHSGWGVFAEYPNDLWQWTAGVNVFGDALDPALGFLPRPGTRQYSAYVQYAPRPGPGRFDWARQFFYELEFVQFDGLDGRTQSRKVFTAPFNVETESGAHFEANGYLLYERLDEPFEIADGVVLAPGAYHFRRYRVELDSPPADHWHYGIATRFGEFYDGHLIQLIPYAYWTTAGGRVRLELNNETDRGELPAGRIAQQLWQLKASYAWSPDLIVSSFIQRDSSDGHTGVNARLHWLLGSGREFFLIFNHGVRESVADAAPTQLRTSNEIVAKLRWDFSR